MDRKVIQLDTLQRLMDIASLSAMTLVEMDHYLQLARAVELYVQSPSAELFKVLHDVLESCKDRHPKFYANQQQLLALLISNGNLTKMDTSNTPPPIPELQSDVPEADNPPATKPTGNVISLDLFRNKKVDNPKKL